MTMDVNKFVIEETDNPSTDHPEHVRIYRDKITHILGVYPKLAPAHIQISLGTSVPPLIWKPIMEAMIKEGLLIEENLPSQSPAGRMQSYVAISLAPTPQA